MEEKPGTGELSEKLGRHFKEMEQLAAAALRREGFRRSKQRHERSLAVRYKGQSFELEIKETGRNISGSFHRAHLERYGYAQESNVVEIVTARVRSTGVVEKLAQRRSSSARQRGFAKAAKNGTAYFDGKKHTVTVYQRDELPRGSQLRTPCIVTEYSSTTLIPPGARGEVDERGNLIIQVR